MKSTFRHKITMGLGALIKPAANLCMFFVPTSLFQIRKVKIIFHNF